MDRHSTGLPALDDMLGGGLRCGTTTVVLGATGIGKTQLGISYANAGLKEDGQRGILCDLTVRGDSQNHAEYASRLADWTPRTANPTHAVSSEDIWDPVQGRSDFLPLFANWGRRVSRTDLDDEEQSLWRAELNRKLGVAIHFFYGNFAHGVRRCVIDGIEPTDRSSDSFQFEIIEYITQQILKKKHDWLARDHFRVNYRSQSEAVQQHAYDHDELTALLLVTSHEVMLDDLLARPIATGDVLSNANTIILMGKTRDGQQMGRSLCIAKHRGSACNESIVPFTIDERGLHLHR